MSWSLFTDRDMNTC